MILLLFAYIGCIGICCVNSYLSIKQGWAVRRDQFIIHAIRCRNLEIEAFNGDRRWFPSNYHPYDKLKFGKLSDILVGTFQYVLQISTILAYSLCISSLFVLIYIAYFKDSNMVHDVWIVSCSALLIILIMITYIILRAKWLKTIGIKYLQVEAEMEVYHPNKQVYNIDNTKW